MKPSEIKELVTKMVEEALVEEGSDYEAIQEIRRELTEVAKLAMRINPKDKRTKEFIRKVEADIDQIRNDIFRFKE